MKVTITLVLINISMGFLRPGPLIATNAAPFFSIGSDSVYWYVFQGKRTKAATYISNYLINTTKLNSDENAEKWLEAAIFYAWSDTVVKRGNQKTNLFKAEAAYKNYLLYSSGHPVNPDIQADRLLYRSLILSLNGLHNQAADSLIASIAIRPTDGSLNQMLLADSYGKLARVHKKTGDLFESSRNFERSISFNRKQCRTEVLAEDLSDFSHVLSTISILDPKADSVLKESLSKYVELHDRLEQAQVLHEIGTLFNYRGNFTKSLSYFKQSLDVKLKISNLDKRELIALYNSISACHQYLNHIDSARYYVRLAIEYAIAAGQNPASFYANLGVYYGLSKEYTQSLEYFQKALFWLDPTTCSPTDLSTNPQINKVSPDLANFTAFKALTFRSRYHQSHNPDDLINGMSTYLVALEMMDTLRFMYSFESKPYLSSEANIHFYYALDIALDLKKLTGDQKYLELAFQLSERNKSAILNEFLRTNKAREYMGEVAPWMILEDSIKQLINITDSRQIGLGEMENSSTDIVLSLQNRLNDLIDELKRIGIAARRENPEYYNMVYSNQGYLPRDIQKLINPGEALIDYTVAKSARLNQDYMVVMVLTRDTLYSFRDTLPSTFREEIDAFLLTLTPFVDARNFKEFSRLSFLMYRYFFKPIERFSGISKLIILPDEELGFLPFEVFVSDTIKPKGSDFRKLSYLNRKYQISYISSHEQFYQFRSKPRSKPKLTVYGFAPFVSNGATFDSLNLFAIENSGEENKIISRYFRTRCFENKKATEPSLRQAFQRESVISLSTHGIINLKKPMQSRLLLNPAEPDGSLYLFEIMSLKVKSSLVILNACNTGTGKLQVGEGILSMARGFQFAGVPTLITTLWPIDDRSSAAVMKSFFKNIHEGMDQRESLMKARNSYIDQATKATAAPYFWAGQVLIGDPEMITIHHRTQPTTILIILVMAALVLASFWVIYKKVR